MHHVASRAGRWPRALIVATTAMLGACAAEPAEATRAPAGLAPNAAVGDVIMVTNRSGGIGVGSLRWAVSHATGGETIRFDSSLAGRMIVLEGTVVAFRHVTIEGDAELGITVSGAGRSMVMYAHEGATLRNMNITRGYSREGAGIKSIGPLTLENVSVFNNPGLAGVGGVFVGT